jgi:hypothetical protein
MECSDKCKFFRWWYNRRYDEPEDFCRLLRRRVFFGPGHDCKHGIEKQPTR